MGVSFLNVCELLLVEDNPLDAALVQRLLNRGHGGLSFRITHVPRAYDALAQLERNHFGSVLLDLGLPDADGPDVIRDVSRAQPRLPVVAITGRRDGVDHRNALELGATDFLHKDDLGSFALRRVLTRSVERARERERVRLAMAHSLDPLLVVALESREIVYANPAAISFFGPAAHQLLGSPFPVEVAGSGSVEFEFELGEDYVVAGSMRSKPVVWDGAPAYLAAIRDTTARRRIEDQWQATAARAPFVTLGQLAVGLSRDLDAAAAQMAANQREIAREIQTLRERGAPPRELEAMLTLAEANGTQLSEMRRALRRAQPPDFD
ncbi:MAG: response regulator [Myxococcota bacterium]